MVGVAAPPCPTVGTGPASECGETMGARRVGRMQVVCEGREVVAAHRTRAVRERPLRGVVGWCAGA